MKRRTLLAVLAVGIVACAILAPVATSFPAPSRTLSKAGGGDPLVPAFKLFAGTILAAALVGGIAIAISVLPAPKRREPEPVRGRTKTPGRRNAFLAALIPLLVVAAVWQGISLVRHSPSSATWTVTSGSHPGNQHQSRQPEATGSSRPGGPSFAGTAIAAVAILTAAAVTYVLALRRRRHPRPIMVAGIEPPSGPTDPPAPSDIPWTEDGTESAILHSYRDMCRFFAKRSGADTSPFTPRQLLKLIGESGIDDSDATLLTRMFEAIRYGHRKLDPEECAAARSIGPRIRKAFEEAPE